MSRLQAARETLTDAIGSLRTTSPTQGRTPSWTVGFSGHYDRIQDVLDESRNDTYPIGVQVEQDYKPQDEQYPIKVYPAGDDTWLPTTIEGAGQGITHLGTPQTHEDIIQVHGPAAGGQYAYHKPVKLSGFTVKGGLPKDASGPDIPTGIKIAGLPNGTIENVTLHNDGHGIKWSAPFIPMTASHSHSFGWRVRDTEAWGCMDDYRIQRGAGAHQTSFTDCLANSAQGAGLRVYDSAAVTWRGGALQLCKGYGARITNCEAFTIRDAYIEGNARHTSYPCEVYTDAAHGLTVDACYFHGINPRPTTHEYNRVQRGLNLRGSKGVSASNNTIRSYGEGFIGAFDSTVGVWENTIRNQTNLIGHTSANSTITQYGRAL